MLCASSNEHGSVSCMSSTAIVDELRYFCFASSGFMPAMMARHSSALSNRLSSPSDNVSPT